MKRLSILLLVCLIVAAASAQSLNSSLIPTAKELRAENDSITKLARIMIVNLQLRAISEYMKDVKLTTHSMRWRDPLYPEVDSILRIKGYSVYVDTLSPYLLQNTIIEW